MKAHFLEAVDEPSAKMQPCFLDSFGKWTMTTEPPARDLQTARVAATVDVERFPAEQTPAALRDLVDRAPDR